MANIPRLASISRRKIAVLGPIGTFLYGFLMRLCGAVGLHHMIYPMFWLTELGGVATVGRRTSSWGSKYILCSN